MLTEESQTKWSPIFLQGSNSADDSYKYKNIANNNDYIWDIAWMITAENIATTVRDFLRNFNGLITAILAIPVAERTFINTLWLLEQFLTKNDFDVQKIIFIHYVSEDEHIRVASVDAEKKLNEFFIEMNMRKDIYDLFVDIYNKEKGSLDEVNLRFIERKLKLFKRGGMLLPVDTRNKIKDLNIELSNLCTEFEKNINDDTTTIELTRGELLGLSKSFIAELDTKKDLATNDSDILYLLTAKYPHMVPVWENAELEETRKRVDYMYNSRCADNNNILFKIIKIREQLADILGYSTWADFVLDTNMAKNPTVVDDFLQDLVTRLTPIRDVEIKKIEAAKGSSMQSYDFRFYSNKFKLEEYDVDHTLIREYFPLDSVLQRMFKYFESLLGVRFTRGLKSSWHEDAWEWLVFDNASSVFIGKFYLDLFPRDNKFTYAACFPLKRRTIIDPYAICAIVCNFSRGTNGKCTLLYHEDVETLYHEFGHGMHNICAITRFLDFAGTQTESDFVEMPSQMLENRCWEFKTIKEISCHYNTGKHMPDELIHALIGTQYVGSGISNCRQIAYGLVDQYIHTVKIKSAKDLSAQSEKIFQKVMGISSQPGTNKLCIFGHLVSGYDARYYGYMWSKVYADDIYGELVKNLKVNGAKYRRTILEPGGSIDAIDMICNFLGRKPSNAVFLKNIGLAQLDNTNV